MTNHPNRARRKAPAWLAKAQTMHERGKSYREIAVLAEVSDRTVRYWLDPASRDTMHRYSAAYYQDHAEEIIAATIRNRKQ